MVDYAIEAMNNSYSPYSKFSVGAAILTKNGKIFTGCNIENSSFPVCCCAERTALFKAVSQGEREFAKIAVVGGRNGEIIDFTPPCGMCRQALTEFCTEDFQVLLTNGCTIKEYNFKELFPSGFKFIP